MSDIIKLLDHISPFYQLLHIQILPTFISLRVQEIPCRTTTSPAITTNYSISDLCHVYGNKETLQNIRFTSTKIYISGHFLSRYLSSLSKRDLWSAQNTVLFHWEWAFPWLPLESASVWPRDSESWVYHSWSVRTFDLSRTPIPTYVFYSPSRNLCNLREERSKVYSCMAARAFRRVACVRLGEWCQRESGNKCYEQSPTCLYCRWRYPDKGNPRGDCGLWDNLSTISWASSLKPTPASYTWRLLDLCWRGGWFSPCPWRQPSDRYLCPREWRHGYATNLETSRVMKIEFKKKKSLLIWMVSDWTWWLFMQ